MMTRFRRDAFGELFSEVNRIQEELQRLFGGNGVAPLGPAVNVWADDHNFYAEADLPDLNLDKLEVFVTDGNQLTIQGERTAPEIKGAVWVRQERPFGRFTRVLTLPTLVDTDKVEAKYDNGVLKLTLPKSEAAKPRKIAIKA
jgi:HSP20 family protein